MSAAWAFATLKMFLSYRFETRFGVTWGIADDAYITADFAKTLAQGGGVRWYPSGPKVEGFSSPIWVATMALIHLLPGFSKDRLGLFVLVANMFLVIGCAWTFVEAVASLCERECGDRERLYRPRRLRLWLPLAALAALPLWAWTARGFEVALVTLLCTLALVEALRGERMRPVRFGLWIGLAFLARMDGLVYCVPAIVVALRAATRRQLFVASAVASAFGVALFASRYVYYREWLPNTYYLKATKWPLSARIPQGINQNASAIRAALVALPPFIFVIWRKLPKARFVVLATVAGHVAALGYSTCLGGDFSFEIYGFDRFTSIGNFFMILAVVATVGALDLSRKAWPPYAALLAGFASFPILCKSSLFGNYEVRRFPEFSLDNMLLPSQGIAVVDQYSLMFVQVGKAIEEFTRPGASLASCAAGGTIYFSERRGVDLLGKVDPTIAHLPATALPPPDHRCWRGNPGAGHNKENVLLSFMTYQPDVSVVEPPLFLADQYVTFQYKSFTYWGRRGSQLVDWEKIGNR